MIHHYFATKLFLCSGTSQLRLLYLSTPHPHPQCHFLSSLKLRIHCLPSALSNWPFQISHSINIYTKNTVPTQQVDDNWRFKSSNDHDTVKYSTKDSYYFKSTVIPLGVWATCNNQIALPAIKPNGVNQDSKNTLDRITVHLQTPRDSITWNKGQTGTL